jgi:hypothetical protein
MPRIAPFQGPSTTRCPSQETPICSHGGPCLLSCFPGVPRACTRTTLVVFVPHALSNCGWVKKKRRSGRRSSGGHRSGWPLSGGRGSGWRRSGRPLMPSAGGREEYYQRSIVASAPSPTAALLATADVRRGRGSVTDLTNRRGFCDPAHGNPATGSILVQHQPRRVRCAPRSTLRNSPLTSARC